MAQPKTADQPPVPAAPAELINELKVTGHLMTLPVGLFCIQNEPHAAAAQRNGMPGVRLSPPPQGAQNVEIIGFRADGWLAAQGDAALVRISNAASPLLVTIYQYANQPDSAPKLEVRQLNTTIAGPPAPAGPPVRMDVMAHIQTRGDVGALFGDWLGEPGSRHWIEGFAIAAPDGIAPADFSYQAVLGRGWLSPWIEAGAYCGSRGMALPLLGLRLRLENNAAEAYDLTYEASFVDGSTSGPAGSDETCEAASLAALEAIKITLTPKPRRSRAKR